MEEVITHSSGGCLVLRLSFCFEETKVKFSTVNNTLSCKSQKKNTNELTVFFAEDSKVRKKGKTILREGV